MDIKARLSKANFDEIGRELYKNQYNRNEQLKRYKDLYKSHIQRFNIENSDFFSSPGRIEVCGNHTDHNNGKVICASINVDTLACVNKTNDNTVIVASQGYADLVVDIQKLDIIPDEFGNSIALVKGVLAYYKQKGYKIGGFIASATSTLYKGAGISSSACYTLLIAQILNYYYNDSKITFEEMARAAQYAEFHHFGKPCGLMDQMAVAAGGIIFIDFKDIADLKYQKIKWDFDDLDIVLVNTGGNHSELTYAYSDIKSEMAQVAAYFGEDVLRKVNEKEFYENISSLQTSVSGRAIQRAMHYFNENKRIDQILKTFKNKDQDKFCELIQESGDSSSVLLQNISTQDDIEQRVALGLALSKSPKVKVEAARVHGGGFAGTILTIVKRNKTKEFIKYMSKIFGDKNIFVVNIRNVGPIKLDI